MSDGGPRVEKNWSRVGSNLEAAVRRIGTSMGYEVVSKATRKPIRKGNRVFQVESTDLDDGRLDDIWRHPDRPEPPIGIQTCTVGGLSDHRAKMRTSRVIHDDWFPAVIFAFDAKQHLFRLYRSSDDYLDKGFTLPYPDGRRKQAPFAWPWENPPVTPQSNQSTLPPPTPTEQST